MTAEAQAATVEAQAPASALHRILDEVRGGNIGSWPILIGLVIIWIVFSLTAPNFFSAVNFNNIIVQMAGITLLAYGVVFVLLLGEIDLSIGFVSGVAGVVVAQLTVPESGHQLPALLAIVLAVGAGAVIGFFQGSFIAIVGVPSFVVTLAGLLAWQGVILQSIPEGVIVIQDDTVNNTANYFFPDAGGWVIAAVISALYLGGTLGGVVGRQRAGISIGNPFLLAAKLVAIPALAFGIVAISNSDRGLPFAGLLLIVFLVGWTYVARRTTFGRHVYAVGGNAEAARRAGINIRRIRILVFMISGAMAGMGGIVLAGRLSSVDLNAGGGTLLLDAIAAAVIGGTSLFGGRGEVRSALLGALVIATIANGLNTLGYSSGVIFMTTGGILLFASTVDTVIRRRQAKTGR
jgi:D-xylose transport system permease protein